MGVYKRGEIWYCRYWLPGGKEKSEAVGPKKRDAEDVLAKRRAQIREGKFFETAPGWLKPYSDILDRYLDYSQAFKRPRTYLLDRGAVARLRQELGAYQVRQLSPSIVLDFIQRLLRSGLSASRAGYFLYLIKHSLKMATVWQLLREETILPIRNVQMPAKLANERIRYLHPEEFVRLWNVCNPLWRRLILIAIHTGMRKHEIMGLRWEQVDLHNHILSIETGTRKNRRPLVVSLTADVEKALHDMHAEQVSRGLLTEWVFLNEKTGRPMRADSDTAWYTALRKAQLTNFHFHDLRHTTASYLRMQGADLRTIQEILGHADLKSTIRYAHISPAHRREAVNKMAQALPIPQDKKETEAT